MRPFDRLHPSLQHHIVNSLGFRSLRPVQDLTIDATLDGKNLIVLAPTAGGKTEAAFFPLLSQTVAEDWHGLSVLYVSPIRALINNQAERLHRYYALIGRTAAPWHGDIPQSRKTRILVEPPDCLLTTPESLEGMLISRKVEHEQFLRNVRAIVIDEVHAFVGGDRGWHLLGVLQRIQRIAGRDLQRIGLSATVGNPEDLGTWISAGSSREHAVIRPPEVDPVEPHVELDYVGSLGNAATIISKLHSGEKRLVFVDSRARVEELAATLRRLGITTFVSHSSLGVEERRDAERAFAEGQNCVIVATSALELGIDVGDLDRVIQIDAPTTTSSFLQRMGRTGRREGTQRNCLFLATDEPALLRAAGLIDLWSQGFVEPVTPPPTPNHILAQQLLALALQEQGIGRSEWFERIRAVPGFRELADGEREALLQWMLSETILWDDEGVLWFGAEGEATYGRMNFLGLVSVFTSPPLFTVFHGKKELGQVHESSFLTKKNEKIVLLLAGQSWEVNEIDWDRRRVYVQEIETDGKSKWRGEGQHLSSTLCQAIYDILLEEGTRPQWTDRAVAQIRSARQDYGWLEAAKTVVCREASGRLSWWTFAGGKANACLSTALDRLGLATKSDNFSIQFRGTPESSEIHAAWKELRGLPVESILPAASEEALARLKFSECLPQQLAMRTLQNRLLDPRAVESALKRPVKFVEQGD